MFILSPTRALEHYIREGVTRRHMLFHYGVLVLQAMLFLATFLFENGGTIYTSYIGTVFTFLYVGIPYLINRVKGDGCDFLARLAVTNTRVFLFMLASLVVILPIAFVMLMIEMPYGLEPDWILWLYDTLITCAAVLLMAKAFWVATRTTQR